MCNRNAKERYLEILSFQHFAKFTTFTTDGDDFRNKELRNKIDASVVLDMECVDMFKQCLSRSSGSVRVKVNYQFTPIMGS